MLMIVSRYIVISMRNRTPKKFTIANFGQPVSNTCLDAKVLIILKNSVLLSMNYIINVLSVLEL